MKSVTRKLIDLEPSVIHIINCKAKSRNTTFKRYVEDLIRKDALSLTAEEEGYVGIKSKDLMFIVGIARDVASDKSDEKLNYIMSKL